MSGRDGRTNLRAPKGRAVCEGAHAAASALVTEIADAISAHGPWQTSCSISLFHPAQRRFEGSKRRRVDGVEGGCLCRFASGAKVDLRQCGCEASRRRLQCNTSGQGRRDPSCSGRCEAFFLELCRSVGSEQRYCEIGKSCGGDQSVHRLCLQEQFGSIAA